MRVHVEHPDAATDLAPPAEEDADGGRRPRRGHRHGAADRRPPDEDRHRQRRDREERRRSELLEAAVRVIRRDGPSASMDRMAAEAGVTKPILYRKFGDRAGLAQAVCGHVLAELDTAIEAALVAGGEPRSLVGGAVGAYLAFVDADPALYRFLALRGPGEPDGRLVQGFVAQVATRVAVALGEALREAGADSGPAEPWAFAIVGMVIAAGDWWLDRRTVPRERLVAYLTDLICDGLPHLAPAAPPVLEGTR